MNRNSNIYTGLRVGDIPLVLSFCLFLFPISVEGLGANYLFLIMPLFYGPVFKASRKPDNSLSLVIWFYIAIFAIAASYQVYLLDEMLRRAVSFVLFMSVFGFLFVSINERMIDAFKTAVVIISTYFSISAIVIFWGAGGAVLHFEAKDITGTQRYGFIYIMASWLIYMAPFRGVKWLILKIILITIVTIGIVLTFSRSSIVGLFASIVAYLIWSAKMEGNLSFLGLLRKIGGVVIFGLAGFAVFSVVQYFFPITIEFFDIRLFQFLSDNDMVESHLSNENTSEGTRIYIWENVLNYVVRNPVTGSGYLGVWILNLFDDMSGSAHNQYFDVLFRTGIVGFLIYLFLLYRIGKFLYVYQPSLFIGFIGVIVYGFFHETFKESHGTFVLSFLLGIASQMTPYVKSDHVLVHKAFALNNSAIDI